MFGRKNAMMVAASNVHLAEEIRNATASASREIAQSNDRLAHTLSENSKREVAARDRVDITLAEYLKMKEDIEILTRENQRLTDFFLKIGLPINFPIIPDSIQKYVSDGPFDVFDLSQAFSIHFKCDISQMTRQQRSALTEAFIHAN